MAQAAGAKQVKVVILGDSGVGKSSIMLRFVTGNFQAESEPTLGGAFMAKVVVCQGVSLKFQIWDTAGQEKYHSLAPMYYRDAQVAILAYDITKKETYESLMKWVNELKENGPMIAIVGNKLDLFDFEQVRTEEAMKFAKDLGALFKMTSAKEDRGIKELFTQVGDEIMKKDLEEINRNRIKLEEETKKKSEGCCSK